MVFNPEKMRYFLPHLIEQEVLDRTTGKSNDPKHTNIQDVTGRFPLKELQLYLSLKKWKSIVLWNVTKEDLKGKVTDCVAIE